MVFNKNFVSKSCTALNYFTVAIHYTTTSNSLHKYERNFLFNKSVQNVPAMQVGYFSSKLTFDDPTHSAILCFLMCQLPYIYLFQLFCSLLVNYLIFECKGSQKQDREKVPDLRELGFNIMISLSSSVLGRIGTNSYRTHLSD